MPDAWNVAAAARLAAAVAALGLTAIRGRGVARHDDWPAEESLLVLGIGRAQAVALGLDLGQNAILWTGADAVPELLECVGPGAD